MVALDHLRHQVPPGTALILATRPFARIQTQRYLFTACTVPIAQELWLPYRIAVEHETVADAILKCIASISTALGIRSLLAT